MRALTSFLVIVHATLALSAVAAAAPAPSGNRGRRAPSARADARNAADARDAARNAADARGAADARNAADARGAADVGNAAETGDPGDSSDAADPSDAAEPSGSSSDRAGLRAAARGPAISAVLAAAYAAAGLDRDPQGGWIRRARLAGLVPWITVRTTHDTSWQETTSEVGHGTSLELRATWRLDRLLFDSKELQIAAVETARRRERRRLAARVIRAYFTWRRAASIATPDERVATRVAEAAAELDALTDGWFSEHLRSRPDPARARSAASENP